MKPNHQSNKGNKILLKIITYLSIIFIYLDTLVLKSVFTFDLYFYYILFPLLLVFLILMYNKLQVEKVSIIVICILLLASIIVVLLKGYSYQYPLKQFFIFTFLFVFYYSIIKVNSFDVHTLFKIYVNITIVVALLGILQVLLYFLNITDIFSVLGISFTHRLKSITSEPSTIAYLFIPVVFVAVRNIFKNEYVYINKLNTYIILLSYLLTFSSIAYLGIFLTIVYNFKSLTFRRKIAYFSLFILLFFAVINIPDLRMRLSDTFLTFFTGSDLEDINVSTLTLFINFKIALEIFKENYIIGTGIGTYGINYNIYFSKLFDIDSSSILQFNKEDANSLFLRLLAETGIVGMFSFFYFIFNFKTRYSLNDRYGLYEALNRGVFILIILRLLRFGNYFALGFPFFILIYVFTYKLSKGN